MDTSVTRLRIRINPSRGFGSLTKHLYESVPDLFEENKELKGFIDIVGGLTEIKYIVLLGIL